MEPEAVTIGLKGIDGRNLGSQLMGLAVRRAFPDAVLAIPVRVPGRNLRRLLSPSGVWSWSDAGGHDSLHRMNLGVSRKLGRQVVQVESRPSAHRVDAVLDLSGYAYGLPLKVGPLLRMADWTEQWASQGIPTVLLPQSFGTFDTPQTKEAMGRILRSAAAVFARDAPSRDNLREIGADVDIPMVPDIAIPITAERAVRVVPSSRPYGLILPNRQINRKTGVSADTYVRALRSAAEVIAASGLEVKVAAHEGVSDDELVKAVAETSSSVRAVEAMGVDRMLGLVRGAEVVVSSRYHGAVAALANGIPAIALGWADKYATLMDEFSVPELCVSVTDADFDQRILSVLSEVLGDLEGVRRALAKDEASRRQRIGAAWSEVRDALGQSVTA